MRVSARQSGQRVRRTRRSIPRRDPSAERPPAAQCNRPALSQLSQMARSLAVDTVSHAVLYHSPITLNFTQAGRDVICVTPASRVFRHGSVT